MAEANLPRLVLVLETSSGTDRIATFQLPTNEAISDVDGNPNLGKAIAYVQEYLAQDGGSLPPP